MELVLQAPSITLEQPKRKAVSYVRHILRIDVSKRIADNDYTHDNLNFTGVTAKEAIALMETDSMIDAVLIHPDSITADLVAIREVAKRKAIPVILHTPAFEPSVKKTAFSVSVDDYHYGTINATFLKRVDFIKRVKSYKNLRGNKPYVTMTL